MKCQRCGNDEEAEFRVVSDVLDIKVCADCAGEARELGPSLKIVEIDKAKKERAATKAKVSDSERWQSSTTRLKNRVNRPKNRHRTRRGAA
jgi:hypothetical protein